MRFATGRTRKNHEPFHKRIVPSYQLYVAMYVAQILRHKFADFRLNKHTLINKHVRVD